MRNARLPRLSRGFTLVELMVGVLIGLIGTVVIFQVFAVSESQKRTTTGGSDAQQNGVFGLFQIERDVRMAGYGMNHMALMGCQINGWYEATNQTFSFKLVPVEIINGAGGLPDRVRIAYSDSDLFMAPAKFTQSMPNSSAAFKVDNKYGFREGDLVVAAQDGKPCTLAQASNVPSDDTNVIHNSGNYTNSEGAQVPTVYNRPGGLPAPNDVKYDIWNDVSGTGGRLYNLGAAPTIVTYQIIANQLVQTNELQPGDPASTFALADGVVQLQAQYGYDGNGDGRVPSDATSNEVLVPGATDQWSSSMPVAAGAAEWTRIIAVRLVVTARSITPEKPDPTLAACNTTTAYPRWVTPAPIGVDINIELADPANWKCYRYRTFEVMVPIRNMLWFPQ